MAKHRLLDLEWSLDDVSFDLLAVTDGRPPGEVDWSLREAEDTGRSVILRMLGEAQVEPAKSRSVEKLVLRHDEDLIGVSARGSQLLLVGDALPVMGRTTETALGEALRQSLAQWSLSYYDVIDAMILRHRGLGVDRYINLSEDQPIIEGTPLPFELSTWDGRSLPDEDVDDDSDEPSFSERLAKDGLRRWLSGTAEARALLRTKLAVFRVVR